MTFGSLGMSRIATHFTRTDHGEPEVELKGPTGPVQNETMRVTETGEKGAVGKGGRDV